MVGEQTTKSIPPSESPETNMTTPATGTIRPKPVDVEDDLSWNPVSPVLEDSFNYEEINRNVWEPMVVMVRCSRCYDRQQVSFCIQFESFPRISCPA